jgi:hypothetical protein
LHDISGNCAKESGMIFTLLAGWAFAAGTASSQQGNFTTPPPGDRLICRSVERTGTRMNAGRLCRTESQWRKDKEDAERVLDGRRDLTDVVPGTPPKPQ